MPLNDVIQGQVIGRLFGTNSTQTVDRAALYTEQRFVPMFIYTPDILDGYATFRGLFKIDYTYGDQAYGVGNNRGGGLSGGQVNLQTLMANVDLRPPGRNYNVVLGLQRIFDNARDPNVNTLDLAQTTGYKLSYWGTQGVGATVFWRPIATTHVRFGAYQLWENIIARDDDVSLFMADLLTRPVPKLEWGVNLWYLRDTASNRGGVFGAGTGADQCPVGIQRRGPHPHTGQFAGIQGRHVLAGQSRQLEPGLCRGSVDGRRVCDGQPGHHRPQRG